MRSTHREEQQFVASVAVTTLRVALVLLLVDPLDDVLMARLKRSTSAPASAPRAGRVLTPCKLQNVQVPSLCRTITSPPIPRARRVLRTRPHQNVQLPSPCRTITSHLTPRARWVLRTRPLQDVQVPFLRRPNRSPVIPRARRVLAPCKLQNVKMPSRRRKITSPTVPRAPVLPKPLHNFQMPSLGRFFNCIFTPARPSRFVSPAGF